MNQSKIIFRSKIVLLSVLSYLLIIVGSIEIHAQDHIATLEHDSPSLTQYTITATIPLPAGKFIETQMKNGDSPFSIQDTDGTIRPLQVTGVTKFANDDQHGFDLVSVSAKISKQNSYTSKFKVIAQNSSGPAWPNPLPASARELVANAPFVVHPATAALFASTNKMVLESSDVFGNLYRCDLGAGHPKLYSYGREKLVFRSACMMTPVVEVLGAQGTLPHLMGILGYFVINKNDEAFRLTLIATNSVSGTPLNNGDARATALKDIFFKRLELKLIGDYGAIPVWETPVSQAASVLTGITTIPVIPARTDGKPHWLRTRWEYPFEYSIHSNSSNGLAQGQHLAGYSDIAFSIEGSSTTNPAQKLFSAHNIETANYGITKRVPWPTLYHLNINNVKSALDSSYAATFNYFKSGKCTLTTINLNNVPTKVCNYPYLGSNQVTNATSANAQAVPTTFFAPVPWGVQYGGMTSGSEIHPGGKGFDVWAARSRKGLLNLYLYMNSRLLRQEVLRKLDGELVSPLDTIVQGPNGAFVPVRAFGGYNMSYCSACDSLFGFNSAPTFHTTYVTSNNLLPDYYTEISKYMQEDEQHKIRTTNSIYAVLQLMAHPRAIDMALHEGYYSYFTNPHLPQYYQGSVPKYQPAALQTFRKIQPRTGTVIGRDFAHTQMARVMGYAVAESAFREFMKPYHQYVMKEIMQRSQMWHGKLINKAAFAKTSPTGQCQVAISREEDFLVLANLATLERVFRGAFPAYARITKEIIINSASSLMHLDHIWPKNNWKSQFSNVMVAHSSSPNLIFKSWAEVPQACKNDAFAGGPDAGEFHFTIATADSLKSNDGLWAALQRNLDKFYPNQQSTLDKLRAISLYNLQSTNNVMNLGYCQVKESTSPGYCK